MSEFTRKPDPDELFHPRRNPAPGVHIQSLGPTIVFLTVKTEDRARWLASETNHRLLHQVWQGAEAWLVGDYVLMPDHLHLFCAPRDLNYTIEQWITFWKRDFRRVHRQADWKFQSRGWHHRLRDGREYSEKWLYMQENPLRRGLVKRLEDWPFKGKVFDVHW